MLVTIIIVLAIIMARQLQDALTRLWTLLVLAAPEFWGNMFELLGNLCMECRAWVIAAVIVENQRRQQAAQGKRL